MDNPSGNGASSPPRRPMNRVIRSMIASDFILMGGLGLLAPVFAVYIVDGIQGGNLAVVGLAQGFYYVARSGFQLPVARLVDRIRGERDDFWVMFAGSLIMSISPLLYIIADTPYELYAIQFIYGFGSALAIPTWAAIWSRHLDHGRETTEWAVHNLFLDLAIAIAAALGGLLAYRYGFNLLFVLMSLFSLTGSLVLVAIKHELAPDQK